MDPTLSKFMESPLFTFTLNSPEGPKDLVVHSQVIAEISQPLKAMMDSPMSEGISKHATLSNVDFDTFSRLCQFAYRRQYSDPEAPSRSQPHEEDQHTMSRTRVLTPSPDDKVEDANSVDWAGLQKYGRHAHMMSQWKELEYRTEELSGWTCPWLHVTEIDCSFVFISHARVYSLAKYYMCESLCNQVLHKMRAILHEVDISSSMGPVVDLIEHVYNDENLDSKGETDRLQHLVTIYAALNTKEIGLASRFVDLLEKGGPFSRAYWTLVCKNIIGVDERDVADEC